ncbi:hypothetical protein ACRAWC_15155 [Leifsonia sp. L25]|uniref:hypothetical protein n=1 Tax=Actinomycetes TaxID=1760 RepID=UPI003D69080C
MSRHEPHGGSPTGRSRHPVLARSLAVLGAVLTGLPLAAPILFALAFLAAGRGLRLDYLMPGELFPLVVAGGAALVAASLIAQWRRMVVSIAFGATALLLALVDVLAAVTGLASGRTAAEGWPLVVVAGTYALYALAVAAMFVLSVLLCLALFSREAAPPAADVPPAQVR